MLLNFPISKMRILDLLRFERVSSLFSASFFFGLFLLCFSALVFHAILPSHHHSIFPLPLVSHVNCRWIDRGNPISSVQFSCSRAVPAFRLVPAGYHVALLPLPQLSCLLLLLQVRPLNLGGARMEKASALSRSSVAGFCFAAEHLFFYALSHG